MAVDSEEIEIKVLGLNRARVVQNLRKIKAKFLGRHNFERIVFDLRSRKDPFASEGKIMVDPISEVYKIYNFNYHQLFKLKQA